MSYSEKTAIRKDEPREKINRSMETLEQNKTNATTTNEQLSTAPKPKFNCSRPPSCNQFVVDALFTNLKDKPITPISANLKGCSLRNVSSANAVEWGIGTHFKWRKSTENESYLCQSNTIIPAPLLWNHHLLQFIIERCRVNQEHSERHRTHRISFLESKSRGKALPTSLQDICWIDWIETDKNVHWWRINRRIQTIIL